MQLIFQQKKQGGSGGNCGPEGLTWEMKDGKPVLTDFGVKAFVDIDESLKVPDEWGRVKKWMLSRKI